MSSVDPDQAASVPLPLSPSSDRGPPTYTAPVDASEVSLDRSTAHGTGENTENAEETSNDLHNHKDGPPSDDGSGSRLVPQTGNSEVVGPAAETSTSGDSSRTTEIVEPPVPPAKSPPPIRSPPTRNASLAPGAAGRARLAEDLRSNGVNGSAPTSRSASPAPHRRSMTISKGRTVSTVLITSALETIAASKDAKRSQPLKESVQRALDLVKSGEGGDRPREIFEPLRLACETRNEKLMIASLDCISKLISYSFFAEPASSRSSQTLPSPPPSPGPGAHAHTSSASHPEMHEISLVDLVVNTITACHTESTPETVSLQIVKALLALVLSSTILVHQSSLLKAVRTVYNVFLLSMDPINQTVAQGGLTQMVNHVFSRCKLDGPSLSRRDSSATLSSAKSNSLPLSAADSPVSVPLPLSPAAVSEARTSTEIETTAVDDNGSKVSLPVDTPSVASVDLPSEGKPETQSESLKASKPAHLAR
jgi:brefeldin A-inhibited guanine nucleotide-exchange protein